MKTLFRRFLKFLAEAGFWRPYGKVHTFFYRLSGGRIGHSTSGITNLLLTTTGRKTGKQRTVPISYIRDGADLIVVASNGGADRAPAWWLNLEARPEATVVIEKEERAVRARRAGSEERARLWPVLKDSNFFYEYHERNADREIPVVILTPTD